MARLDGENGASGGEIALGHNVGRGTKVGGNANTLEDGRSSDERLDVSHTEIVGALSDGSGSGS